MRGVKQAVERFVVVKMVRGSRHAAEHARRVVGPTEAPDVIEIQRLVAAVCRKAEPVFDFEASPGFAVLGPSVSRADLESGLKHQVRRSCIVPEGAAEEIENVQPIPYMHSDDLARLDTIHRTLRLDLLAGVLQPDGVAGKDAARPGSEERIENGERWARIDIDAIAARMRRLETRSQDVSSDVEIHGESGDIAPAAVGVELIDCLFKE